MGVEQRVKQAGMKALAGLLLIVGLWVVPAIAAADGIHGYVYEGFTQPPTPLPGVTVVLKGATGSATTRTNARGFFAFIGLAPGTYQVVLTGTGLATSLWNGLIVEPGEVSTVSWLMFRRGSCCYDPLPKPSATLVDPDQSADVYNIH